MRPKTFAERHTAVLMTEQISKSRTQYVRMASEAGMKIVSQDEEYYEFEGTQDQYNSFLMAAHDFDQIRD